MVMVLIAGGKAKIQRTVERQQARLVLEVAH
jgi:hypothetical protein